MPASCSTSRWPTTSSKCSPPAASPEPKRFSRRARLEADALRATPCVPTVLGADPLGDDDLLELRRLTGGRREVTTAVVVPVLEVDPETALPRLTGGGPVPSGLALRHLVPERVVLR